MSGGGTGYRVSSRADRQFPQLRDSNRKLFAFVLFLMLFFCNCDQLLAESSVWKAQKGNSTIFLGGTFHLLRDADYPLPPEFERAYQASDIIVLETDVGKLSDPLLREKLLQKAVYPDGSTIDSHLSPKVYAELRAYCEANGIPLQALVQLKPSMLMATVTLMELSRMGVSKQGVDQFYFAQAKKDGKSVEELETVDEQINYLVSLGDGNEDEFVAHSLEEMKRIGQQFETFVNAWRSGDAAKLGELMVSEMKASQPQLYRKLITDRNKNWLRSMEAYQKSRLTRFVLVGAGHLVGPDGIVEALKKKGYKVNKQ